MKTTFSRCLVAVALFAGTAMAGSPPTSDAPRDEMRADTDHDGRVSRAEYDAAASQRRSDWFDKLDLNKDGYISQDEMQKARETRRANLRGHMDEKFKEADANGDGQLSLDEVQAKMPRLADHFGDLDQDKNGLLTKEELAQGHRGRGPRPTPAT
jgi:Ca2+-binding EF-hand superfamily protein